MERLTYRKKLKDYDCVGVYGELSVRDVVHRLAVYENTGVSPEEIRDAVNRLKACLGFNEPVGLKTLINRCVYFVNCCTKSQKDLDAAVSEKEQLERELDVAKRNIAALMWLNGDCRYCRHAKKESYYGASQVVCSLEDGKCRPEWSGGKEL